jgi:putative two-component system response regulator
MPVVQPDASAVLTPRVLVIDDSAVNRQLLRMLIGELGYSTEEAADGPTGLALATADPPDLILLDILMPGMDGRHVLSALKTEVATHRVPVVMISSLDEMEAIVNCIQLGADDYFTRPFDRTLLRARMDVLLERKWLQDSELRYRQQIEQYNLHLEDRVTEQLRLISEGHVNTIFAMSKLAESRDPETGLHLERMREFCRILAQHLQRRPEFTSYVRDGYIDALYAASPLHDIGKVGIPDSILLKPGRHSDEERAVMERHTIIGAETLRAVHAGHSTNDLVTLGIQIAESHHERWDGKGYPYGKAGTDIPLSARILALADVYDALRAARVYKPAFSHEEARVFILNGEGTHFDPAVVDAFRSAEPEFIRVREQWDSGH